MGLYDTISFPVELLPVPGETKELIRAANPEWQTKCLECMMQHYKVTEAGELLMHPWHFEDDENGWHGIVSVDDPVRKIETDEIVSFYTSDVSGIEWLEFLAVFKSGKLDYITQVT